MKKLDVYLADLLVGNVLLHNLHWNVYGLNFKATHEYLEDLYDDFFKYFDDVAEFQKQQGVNPKASVKAYLELSDIKELESKDVEEKEAIRIALDLVKHMKGLALEIRDEADCFVLANMLEDHVADYNKRIWFMESMVR